MGTFTRAGGWSVFTACVLWRWVEEILGQMSRMSSLQLLQSTCGLFELECSNGVQFGVGVKDAKALNGGACKGWQRSWVRGKHTLQTWCVGVHTSE